MNYNYEDIFTEIPNDPDHVLMNIPEDICNQMGWKEGTVITIEVKDDVMVIRESDAI